MTSASAPTAGPANLVAEPDVAFAPGLYAAPTAARPTLVAAPAAAPAATPAATPAPSIHVHKSFMRKYNLEFSHSNPTLNLSKLQSHTLMKY